MRTACALALLLVGCTRTFIVTVPPDYLGDKEVYDALAPHTLRLGTVRDTFEVKITGRDGQNIAVEGRRLTVSEFRSETGEKVSTLIYREKVSDTLELDALNYAAAVIKTRHIGFLQSVALGALFGAALGLAVNGYTYGELNIGWWATGGAGAGIVAGLVFEGMRSAALKRAGAIYQVVDTKLQAEADTLFSEEETAPWTPPSQDVITNEEFDVKGPYDR